MAERTRWKTVAWRGAARVAPTAPHATPPSEGGPDSDSGSGSGKKRKRSGPERFWWPRYVVPALSVGLVLSLAAHVAFFGRSLFEGESLEFNDQDGEAAIPIELLSGDPDPEPEAPAPPPNVPAPLPTSNDPNASALDAGLARDSGSITDAAITDSSSDASREIPDSAIADHVRDAASDLTSADASAIASTDAGVAAPHDAVDMVGVAGTVQTDPQLVTLLVNMSEIRKNPVGVQAGPLMSAIPQWDEFMAGSKVDPVKDTDWVLITGPSLKDTSRDIILVHYSTNDAIVDHAIDLIQKRSANGAPFDAGVPGVKASLAHADRAPRVFLRPQSHLVAVTPPDVAAASARVLKTARVNPHVRPGEAMRLVLKHPHGPFPQIFPDDMSELDIWIIPRAAGGADVYGDGICPNEQSATAAAAQATKMFHSFTNSFVGGIANSMSGNTLDGIRITLDGAHVKATAPISQEQLEAMLNLAATQLNVVLPAAPLPSGQAPSGQVPGASPPNAPPR